MKLGSESRTKLIIALVLLCVAVILLWRMITFSPQSAVAAPSTSIATAPAPAQPATKPVQRRSNTRNTAPALLTDTLDPTLRTDLLKASEGTRYEGNGRNIFRAQAEPVVIQQPVQPVITKPAVNTPPPPPPINLKFYGFASRPGEAKKIFLSQGEDIFVASEGDIVKSRYKVLRIGPTSVEIEDVLSNNRQSIPLTQS